MQLHFTVTEPTFSYFEATREYRERYGQPVAFYTDRANAFRSKAASKTGRSLTHFGRAHSYPIMTAHDSALLPLSILQED